MRLITALLLTVMISACATNDKILEARDQSTATPKWMKNTSPTEVTSCCSSVHDLPFVDLASNRSKIVEIAKGTPAFDFQQGTSRFAAYQLSGNSDNPRKIRIKTFRISGGLSFAPLAFYPAASFLDPGFAIINTVEPEFLFEDDLVQGSSWVAEISVPSNANYLVIHTPHTKLGYPFSTGKKPTPVVIPVGGVPIPIGPGQPDGVFGANAGRFEILLKQ